MFLFKSRPKAETNKVSNTIVGFYKPMLNWVLDNHLKFMFIPLGILIVGLASYINLGKEFMPSINEGDIFIYACYYL